MPDISIADQFAKAVQATVEQKKLAGNPNKIARDIINDYQMIYYGDSFFRYDGGKYKILTDVQTKKIVHDHLKDDYRQAKYKEVTDCMLAICQVENINIMKGVNLLNGVLELRGMQLLEHSDRYLFTTQLQVTYDPNAKAPRWEAFLQEMLGDDKDKIQILQEYSGYCLDPNLNIEVVLFLLGRGSNGKSVFCDALKNVFGEGNYDTISLDDLKNKNYLADLLGKLVNISTESQSKAEVYESNLKRLASGEEIKADRKFKNPFTFKSNCKHIYCLNNLPRVGDKTDAFFRRVITIPFNKQVSDDRRVFRLGAILGESEASGILNWMLDGYKRLRDNKWQFTFSQQAYDTIANYRKDNNNVLNFVDELCLFHKDSFLGNNHLYAEYKAWCKDSGVQPLKKTGFLNELVENFKLSRDKVGGNRGLFGLEFGHGRDVSEPF